MMLPVVLGTVISEPSVAVHNPERVFAVQVHRAFSTTSPLVSSGRWGREVTRPDEVLEVIRVVWIETGELRRPLVPHIIQLE